MINRFRILPVDVADTLVPEDLGTRRELGAITNAQVLYILPEYRSKQIIINKKVGYERTFTTYLLNIPLLITKHHNYYR